MLPTERWCSSLPALADTNRRDLTSWSAKAQRGFSRTEGLKILKAPFTALGNERSLKQVEAQELL